MENFIKSQNTNFFKYLGTFWSEIPDEEKQVFLTYWQALYDFTNLMQVDMYKGFLSKGILNCPPYFNNTAQYYDVVFSGVGKNVGTVSGMSVFVLEDVLDIPYLTHTIIEPSIPLNSTITYLDGVDYEVLEGRYIKFTNGWTRSDYAYSGLSTYRSTLYTQSGLYNNPAIYGVYGGAISFDRSLFYDRDYLPNYVNSGLSSGLYGTCEHYKSLIEALCKVSSSSPTVDNILHGYQLARGAPFAHISGIASVAGQDIELGSYSYTIPSGLPLAVGDGDTINKFDILTSGVYLYDMINNSGLIMATYSGINDFYNKYFIDDNLSGLNYSSSYLTTYMELINPAGLDYRVI